MEVQVLEDGAGRAPWNAELYDERHAFVWKSAGGILEWLGAQAGERILDVGCGTGHLTAQIGATGAHVVGMDFSRTMLDTARQKYPSMRWVEGDARDFSLESLRLNEPLDAIFSNATLHWVRPPQKFLACAFEVLKPGGRLVAEFGARLNVEHVLTSIEAGLREVGAKVDVRENFFPSIGEYASLCESAGLQVLRAEIFERPTLLEGAHGLRGWARMFRPQVLGGVREEQHEPFFRAMEEAALSHLLRDGQWFADYVRLRIFAVKAASST